MSDKDQDSSMRERVKQGYEEADFPESQDEVVELDGEGKEMFDSFIDRLPDNAHVVDMGCGSGVPYDKILVERGYGVTGVDIAETNIRAARERVPEARYIRSDFTDFDPDKRFEGLLCMFALFHIPREEHAETLAKFRGLLEEEALILITMGTEDVKRMTDDFDGAEMEWSFYGAEKNREIIEGAGFDILETDRIPDDRGEGEHLWVLARAV